MQVRLWPTSPTPDTNCFRHSSLAAVCGPSGPKPHATRTVIIFFDILIVYFLFHLCFCPAVLAFIFLIFLYVYCYAPIYQINFLLCENLLGNNPDSDLAKKSHKCELNLILSRCNVISTQVSLSRCIPKSLSPSRPRFMRHMFT